MTSIVLIRAIKRPPVRLTLVLLALALPAAAVAQRTDENVVTNAADAFGSSLGEESIGLYGIGDVRGFSPVVAGNQRLEGIYFTQRNYMNGRLFAGADIHVGISSLGYPFPAPTGIADYRLRPAGERRILSAIAAAGPFDGRGADLDLQLPLASTFTLAGGISFRRFVDQPGGDGADLLSVGLAPAWRPGPNVEIRPYWGRITDPSDITTPFIFVSGAHLPPRFKRRSYAQGWTGWDARIGNHGFVGNARLGGWRLDLGWSRAIVDYPESYNDLYLDTGPDGIAARHVINAYPPTFDRTTAAEARASRFIVDGPRRHALFLSLRRFAQDRTYGGAASVDFGPARIGERVELARPTLAFGTPSEDDIRQWTAGIGYSGQWAGLGEINLGLQRADYRKTTHAPSGPPILVRSSPWLWNGTLAVNLASRLVAYGGYTRGLEESPVAPEIAVNRNEAPPAILTSQWDAGVRYSFTPRFRLIAGLFEIRKPYFNLDPNLVYGRLGTVRHRGLEVSLAGELARGLNLVGGAVLMQPRISGEAIDLGLIGPRPVGQTARTLRLDLDYRPKGTSPFSADLAVVSYGRRTASQDNLLSVPATTLIDLGARYRFEIDGHPATLRLLVENVTNRHSWTVSSAGGFRPEQQRRASASLAVDF